MRRIIVTYVYHESPAAKVNLEFFQKHGMYCKRSDILEVDYVLVVNGPDCSVETSDKWDLVMHRENNGYDFCAWKDALNFIEADIYDYFIFLNNTVRGPYGNVYWPLVFTDLLNDRTKLAGISINCNTSYAHFYSLPAVPHTQSMLWLTDKIGMQLLAERFWPFVHPVGKEETVVRYELGLSLTFLKAGYNISCILKEYQKDYQNPNNWLTNTNNGYSGDPWFSGSYFGRSLEPLECIFFKTNRNVNPEILQMLTEMQNRTI